ncbi:putative HTH-type transcriptional regulator YjjM [Shimia sp. SK013]|uniref:GntR family transcriptional regulator n=1 Tax=Shimia sp. SK013 TaxID=1389006 RepID=UPI0006B63E8A|nr:GntR family transcriptional regulator [Shimia sp. SK013]KPA20283.1 putative HTH-type transcriptional regulator YjjM [Shimia sp. SK013]
MSRDNSTYKDSLNRSLDFVAALPIEGTLPSEVELTQRLGISRTTVRAVLTQLNESGIIQWSGRTKTVLRKPVPSDYFAQEETLSTSARVETLFMEFILGGDLKPGTILHESEMVREFGASTSVLRECLIKFSRFGLIEKEPNRHWVLRGFTQDFAIELFDVREMFELRAFQSLVNAGPDATTFTQLIALDKAHEKIIRNIDAEYLNFPRLDEQFHRILLDGLSNRFIDDFFELVSVIFHYHYRWNKKDEHERNLVAAQQHLAVIRALAAGDKDGAIDLFQTHLNAARSTLLGSVTWDHET